MQMHQIRYFLALCEELSFTRAARRCGISQPSLTNAIGALERELGGALFRRKPLIALTALGHAMQPYLERIAQNADHAREAAQALAHVPAVSSDASALHHAARSPE
jgi:LysR family hydrogen peroxide-inducible transcriptional activator